MGIFAIDLFFTFCMKYCIFEWNFPFDLCYRIWAGRFLIILIICHSFLDTYTGEFCEYFPFLTSKFDTYFKGFIEKYRAFSLWYMKFVKIVFLAHFFSV